MAAFPFSFSPLRKICPLCPSRDTHDEGVYTSHFSGVPAPAMRLETAVLRRKDTDNFRLRACHACGARFLHCTLCNAAKNVPRPNSRDNPTLTGALTACYEHIRAVHSSEELLRVEVGVLIMREDMDMMWKALQSLHADLRAIAQASTTYTALTIAARDGLQREIEKILDELAPKVTKLHAFATQDWINEHDHDIEAEADSRYQTTLQTYNEAIGTAYARWTRAFKAKPLAIVAHEKITALFNQNVIMDKTNRSCLHPFRLSLLIYTCRDAATATGAALAAVDTCPVGYDTPERDRAQQKLDAQRASARALVDRLVARTRREFYRCLFPLHE